VNLAGVVTWSFEFEDQPYFEGFRELATNGLDKPVLNTFRILAMLGGERVKLTSTATATPESVLRPGSALVEGVDGIATRRGRELDVMVWNYREEDASGPGRKVSVEIGDLPASTEKLEVEEFRVDGGNSNSYAAWRKMGSPQHPSAAQRAELELAGGLKRIGAPKLDTSAGKYVITLELPQQSVSLLRVHW
jgi:xylan 1,4-beta-xylosidase